MLYGYRQFHCIHKTVDIYKDIAEDFQTVFDTSNYELDRPFPKWKKSSCIKERWIMWINNEKLCWINRKNV